MNEDQKLKILSEPKLESLKSSDIKLKQKQREPVVVVASGYLSPIHGGHIEYLEMSKALGDYLIVVVNSDKQEIMKKGSVFINCAERMKVVKALRCVDMVVEAVDQDRSISKTLEILRPHIFTNGGDQFNKEIPERDICERLNIKMVDGLGAKIQSSSAIIAKAKKMADYKDPSFKK